LRSNAIGPSLTGCSRSNRKTSTPP
jgi:hypothetical protein